MYLGTEDFESSPPADHRSVQFAPSAGKLAPWMDWWLGHLFDAAFFVSAASSKVVFFSRLWHEVLPAYRLRRALTLWILRPEEEESWIPSVF